MRGSGGIAIGYQTVYLGARKRSQVSGVTVPNGRGEHHRMGTFERVRASLRAMCDRGLFFLSLFRFDGGARSLRACLPSCHCCPPRKERRFPGYCFKRLISFFLPPLLGLSYTRDGAALPMSLNYSGLSPSGSKPTLTRSLPCTPRAFRARVGCERKKKRRGGRRKQKATRRRK